MLQNLSNSKIKHTEHTHASEASNIIPMVQKLEKIIIQLPLFEVGINSKNHDVNKYEHPRPMPVMNRRVTNVT